MDYRPLLPESERSSNKFWLSFGNTTDPTKVGEAEDEEEEMRYC
jgi:hypothetical protein